MQRKLWITLCLSLLVISQSIFPTLAMAATTTGANGESAIQILEKVTDQTLAIRGKSFANAEIKVENKAGLLNSTQTDSDGAFEVAIEKQPANTILKITADDGAEHTYSIEVTVVATGWVQDGNKRYYYGPDGEKQTGWITDNGSRYFLDQNGVMKTGWLFDNGKWYFLKNSGAMQTSWLYDNWKWYFLTESGAMATGWVLDGDKWYYLNGSGTMQIGWVKISNRWYYLNRSGAMQTGWLYYGGKWYYLNQSGVMATGWVLDGVKWYFLQSDGSMKTGWIQSGRDWFYLGGGGAVSTVQLDSPLIAQMPELPRGCEVTSLAMMLLKAGVQANKMTLASQVQKDPTPFTKINGQVNFGNPYSGFVGDMYTFNKPGLAVYHGPIAELAEKYLPNRVVNFTGSNFEEIYKHLNNGKPVWVINNVLFDTVPSQYWETWSTPTGKISITYKEHSVLITGYDSQYIYFNDPLSSTKNRKVTISAFKRGWEQMGKQAITYR
ncbi:C39 family peptidase [Neobacillus sp.]|uniref:C39 family peptidase n=1 Tax=Neobacillus sp. TaxID=2675273 RepID=UPI0028A1B021|nr:C39 family peptidase [Neobacillus sp.]